MAKYKEKREHGVGHHIASGLAAAGVGVGTYVAGSEMTAATKGIKAIQDNSEIRESLASAANYVQTNAKEIGQGASAAVNTLSEGLSKVGAPNQYIPENARDIYTAAKKIVVNTAVSGEETVKDFVEGITDPTIKKDMIGSLGSVKEHITKFNTLSGTQKAGLVALAAGAVVLTKVALDKIFEPKPKFAVHEASPEGRVNAAQMQHQMS